MTSHRVTLDVCDVCVEMLAAMVRLIKQYFPLECRGLELKSRVPQVAKGGQLLSKPKEKNYEATALQVTRWASHTDQPSFAYHIISFGLGFMLEMPTRMLRNAYV